MVLKSPEFKSLSPCYQDLVFQIWSLYERLISACLIDLPNAELLGREQRAREGHTQGGEVGQIPVPSPQKQKR